MEKHDRVNAEVEVPPTLTAVALHDEEWSVSAQSRLHVWSYVCGLVCVVLYVCGLTCVVLYVCGLTCVVLHVCGLMCVVLHVWSCMCVVLRVSGG